jgi:hyperosmotically inducible periplasmic protein
LLSKHASIRVKEEGYADSDTLCFLGQDREKREESMRSTKTVSSAFLGFALALTLACSNQTTKAPDVSSDIRHALDQAGLKDVSVSQDREKSVVTLTGSVSNEVGVRPGGDQGDAKKIDSDLDSAIDKNLEAMLVQHKLKSDVQYDVNNGVVTLKGDVHSQAQRASVEKLAQQVPNVKQVVNEIDVKKQKATSTK